MKKINNENVDIVRERELYISNLKNRKGLTLVALIVTIIILLILAGVTIAQLTESGLFNKAKLAEQKSENEQIKEETTIFDYEDKIDKYLSNSRQVTEDDLNSMFYPNKSVKLSLTNNEVTIDRNGWLYIFFNKTTIGEYYWAKRNGIEIFHTSVPTINCADSTYIPVKKGDIISVKDSAYFTLTLMYYEK